MSTRVMSAICVANLKSRLQVKIQALVQLYKVIISSTVSLGESIVAKATELVNQDDVEEGEGIILKCHYLLLLLQRCLNIINNN